MILPAYAASEIAEVWIVNLNESVVEVYREPSGEGYQSKLVVGADSEVRELSALLLPELSIQIAEFPLS